MDSSDAKSRLDTILPASVPDDYLKLLSHYPPTLLNARRAIDDSNDEGMVSQVELQIDLEAVLELNLEAREDSVPDPDGAERLWPDQFLIVGETGGGDYYCIDVLHEVPGVMQYDHQAVEYQQVAESLAEFVEILEDTFCEDLFESEEERN